MNTNTEQKLGFDRIREMVEGYCTNALARQMVQNMSFLTDFSTLQHELSLTEEMRQIVLMENAFPTQDYIDLSPTLSHLRTFGTSIEQQQLFEMSISLNTIHQCLTFFLNDEEAKYPHIKELAEAIIFDEGLIKRLKQVIDDKGEICDSASPHLQEIRHTIARKSAEVDIVVARQLSRAKKEGWTSEEAEPTIRNGRLVIPVLDTHRRKLKGLIHDESATGRTAYVEPSEVVELGNDLRELEFEERHEIQRILLAVSEELRPQLENLKQAYSFLAKMDFLRAKSKVAIDVNACVPLLTERAKIDWYDARHPLLILQKGDNVVPFSMHIGETDNGCRVLIISGPNAGGKSVCLKAVGLLQYMLQCGMPIPVRPTSECGVFQNIMIDIGDSQSIENDLSTYTSHLQNLKMMVQQSTSKTLFLLDELGGGTEPRSGCAIAEAVLEHLCDMGSIGVVTTHFADLKLLADRIDCVQNAAMLYDTEKMKPLYRLSVGHPGSSFAFEIAKSIGFPTDILDEAEKKVGTEMLNFEHQLQQLELDKQEIAQKQEQLRLSDELLNSTVEKYQRLYNDLEAKRHSIVSKARREAQDILLDANRTIEHTINEIKSSHADSSTAQRLRQKISEKKENIQKQIAIDEEVIEKHRANKQTHDETDIPISVGVIVRIDGGENYAQVVDIRGKKAAIENGTMRMTIDISRLSATKKQKIPTVKNNGKTNYSSIMNSINSRRAEFNPTLDIRGKRVNEALDMLNQFIDNAMLLGEHEIRVLHGKGYGVLMNVVRDELRHNGNVRSLRSEQLELGGEGITVVELR